ncbi:MAG: hypothetical protein HY401_05885 [Elusimicrobia bacterium]|nr:hypothetical protein [Elusimicrobiota bacterium]
MLRIQDTGYRIQVLKKETRFLFCLSTVYCLLSTCSWADFLPKNAFSNKARGTTAASFLKIAASARASALADSIALGPNDPLGGFGMPAAYASNSQRKHLALASGILPENIVQTAVTAGIPYRANAKLAFSVHQIIQPSLTLYDNLGSNVGEFRPTDTAIGAGYAASAKEIRWGFSLFYLYSKIGPSLSGSGVSSNFGLHLPYDYFEDPNLSLGLAVVNFGPPAKWGSRSTPLPMKAQAQAGYKLGALTFLNLDLALPADQAPYGIASLEWKIPLGTTDAALTEASGNGFSVRLGITSKNKTDSVTDKLSFGLGLALGKAVVDASFASFGNLGFFPRLGLNLAF